METSPKLESIYNKITRNIFLSALKSDRLASEELSNIAYLLSNINLKLKKYKKS